MSSVGMTIGEDAMPGAAHPAYADVDRESLFHMARRTSIGVVQIPFPKVRPLATFDPTLTDVAFGVHTLTLRKMAAPCPYVGTQQQYIWEVLVDEAGRCLADTRVYRWVNQSRAHIEGWQGADDEWPF